MCVSVCVCVCVCVLTKTYCIYSIPYIYIRYMYINYTKL